MHFATIKTITGHTRSTRGVTTPTMTGKTVPASVSLLSQREQFIAEQAGRTVNVAVLVPSRTEVSTDNEVVVSGTGELGLDGHYKIVEVRPDRHTTRLLCARYEV